MPLTSHYGSAPGPIYGDRPPSRAPYVPSEDELERQMLQNADPTVVNAAISGLEAAAEARKNAKRLNDSPTPSNNDNNPNTNE